VERRRRLVTRTVPLAVVALIAFVAGVIKGSAPPAEKQAAENFVAAWAQQDFASMHTELDPTAQRQYSTADLRGAYLDAQQTATLRTIDPGGAEGPDSSSGRDVVTVPISLGTVAFGHFDADLKLPFVDGGIAWAPYLAFPGVRAGERLEDRIALSHRGEILARDGTLLAKGPPEARTHSLGSAAIDVTGEVGQAEASALPALARQGFPAGTPVGISGLERAFNRRLAGKPGGELVAANGSSKRVLAHSRPSPGKPLKTTIDPTLQQTAVAGLAGRAGGVAVLDARSGAVRALAGTAFSAPQPPGSTFKVVTTTAALQKGVVSLDDQFPFTTGINVGGRLIANAHDESCGGSFTQAFAESCNAVFAPLGPKIGNDQMVSTAERYGFNSEPTLYDRGATAITAPPEPSIPEQIGDDLDLGVTAIGQGQVLATPLEMASIAQTVGLHGIRRPTPIVAQHKLQANTKPVRVMSRKVAGQLRDLMIGVVTSGTGTAAALPGVQVAGKTGTAELGPKPGAPSPPPGQQPEQAVDAWFTSFAPAKRPRLAVAVLLVDANADGGTVAAPVAHDVLAAGLLG
jgi:penicillin-binding protein A